MELFDYLDVAAAKDLAGRVPAGFIDTSLNDPSKLDPRNQGCVSLRLRLVELLHRNGMTKGLGLKTLYKRDGISDSLDINGRLVAGISSPDDLGPLAETKFWKDIMLNMPLYRGSNCLFNERKLLRQFLRGGAEGPCLDLDVPCSFPQQLAARHGLQEHVDWVHTNAACVDSCGLPREVVKELVNAAPGIGNTAIQEWQTKHKVFTIPAFLKRYIRSTQIAMRLDRAARPDLVAKLVEAGILNEYEQQNIITFCLNSLGEHGLLMQGMEVLSQMDDTFIRALEYDGLVVSARFRKTANWQQRVQAAVPFLTLKPYKPMAELWQQITDRVPMNWVHLSPNWEKPCQKIIELYRRLQAGEQSPKLVAVQVLILRSATYRFIRFRGLE